ncbi:MAG: heat-inducible transcription repressor HrcA [Chloroflexi bacterium CG_4_9_14_3_um_filter_45_9]|nr:MAG: heat-inducible transcription repressor HrcA [Dehalococcoidia bacterium CG2_30_46_9]PIU23975.1 MAG: heat-inducible transcription repressor HrcA [Chloroflexi bacterium CG08_land_8_20_14_0_20_45_12]PIX27554.1 MAG: heat-inducible transcription repressor HrcA [Chloroflexi bacterium CG_4_8_14_3_um_filter_45_15]PJB50021.1 MAG: heat-inducible transcription repressor HrcA [Chloroflexi bacterium CG_4_9_14_3_um_filter_45_9]
MTLTEREKTILRVIIADYIVGAKPVASKAIVNKHGLKVSPATIRNDMAYLEQEGYITHPHTSAGSIPTDKAYRYYVESISEDVELSLAEQHLVFQLFQQAQEEMEEWVKVAAALLSRLVRNMAVVTSPKATRHYFKHLDIVSIQDFLALLILVLYETKITQKTLSLNRALPQSELTKLANKFNALYAGIDSSQILASKAELSPEEEQISMSLAEMMAAEDKRAYGKPYLEGLRLLLSQPELFNNPKLPAIVGVLESEDWLEKISYRTLGHGEMRIIIGEENPEAALQDLSLIIGQYGIPDKISGLLGVVGPKRMDYGRSISWLNYLTTLLSNKVTQYV